MGGYPKVPTPYSAKVLTPYPGQDGEGIPQGSYPLPCPAKVPTPPVQVRMGGGGTYTPTGQVPYPPPPPPDRTAYGVLDMLQSVCLLRSHWRTFLFPLYSLFNTSRILIGVVTWWIQFTVLPSCPCLKLVLPSSHP